LNLQQIGVQVFIVISMQEITNETLNERLNNFFRENKEDHNEIIKQTTKTNGTVQDLQRWRYTMTGGLLVLNLFIVPVVIFLVCKYLGA
jgi:hypothetical protein